MRPRVLGGINLPQIIDALVRTSVLVCWEQPCKQDDGSTRADNRRNRQLLSHDLNASPNVQAQPPPLSVTPKRNPDNRIS